MRRSDNILNDHNEVIGFTLFDIPHGIDTIQARFTNSGRLLSAVYERRDMEGITRYVSLSPSHRLVVRRLRVLGKSWAGADTPEKQSRLDAVRRV